MSDPAAPWWADVQHLRPREDHVAETPAQPTPSSAPSRRFARGAAEQHDASVATLEHEIADPWASDDLVAPWAETLDQPVPHHEPEVAEPKDTLWDASLEEAFASTPSWADEDDPRLLPKGADRIENGRRTIEIRGQVDRVVGVTAPVETGVATRSGRRRPARRPAERLAGRPDRVAMWAFLLGILLILIAALTGPGDASVAALTL
jgi:hypothetical protein